MNHPTKQVAAIHDLSGFGRASLMIVIPILSAMGIQVCPLPSSILSTNCAFSGYSLVDFTSHLSPIIDHWKSLRLKFDAIYSGFLGSPQQVEIIERIINDFGKSDALVMVDPVLGDNGSLYSSFDQQMVEAMQVLYKKANIITPNLTEMYLLLNRPYNPQPSLEEIKDLLRILSDEGPEITLVSSVPEENARQYRSVIAYEKQSDRFWKVSSEYFPANYSGTGDLLASIILGSLLQGDSLPLALDRAIHFIGYGIRTTFGYPNYDTREGILLEKILPILATPSPVLSYRLED